MPARPIHTAVRRRPLRRLTLLAAVALPGVAIDRGVDVHGEPERARSARSFDLDVGLAPGSPIRWAQQIPVVWPGPALFAPRPVDGGGTATSAAPSVVTTDVRVTGSFGLVRILTWDLTGHLVWLDPPEAPGAPAPLTGLLSSGASDPRPGDPLYWICAAPLLRLMLHPQRVSSAAVGAHLIELGDLALPMLRAARSEKALEEFCDRMIRTIETPATPRRLAADTPRERMWLLFLMRELLAEHPHDPEGAFGRNVFLLPDGVEPALIKLAGDADARLRRNATAALGRLSSTSARVAVGRLAATTDDPVVRMRALSAVGSPGAVGDPRALRDRLRRATDPSERVALIDALGRVGFAGVVPVLLELVAARPEEDPDLLQAVLAALVRIDSRKPEVLAFLDRIGRMATAEPRLFAIDEHPDAPRADARDPQESRGRIIRQLALIGRVRADPTDARAVARLLEFLGPSGRRATRPGRYGNGALENVEPPVRYLFLEVLRELGERGVSALDAIARDLDIEPTLRGHALARLPVTHRSAAALATFDVAGDGDEIRSHAFQVLVADGHARMLELGRAVLRRCHAERAGASAELRYLAVVVLRGLSSLGLLTADDLTPMLDLVRWPRSDGAGTGAVLRRSVRTLVNDIVGGLRGNELRKRIHALIDFVVRRRIHPDVTDDTRDDVIKRVTAKLRGLRGHREDTAFHHQMVDAVLEDLLPLPPTALANPARAVFQPTVLLEQEVLFALGRTKSNATVHTLVRFLEEDPDSEFRPHAVLALGMTGRRSVRRHVVSALTDEDSLTRLCAYESIQRLTGQDFWCDWLFGTPPVHAKAAERYATWIREN